MLQRFNHFSSEMFHCLTRGAHGSSKRPQPPWGHDNLELNSVVNSKLYQRDYLMYICEFKMNKKSYNLISSRSYSKNRQKQNTERMNAVQFAVQQKKKKREIERDRKRE